MFKRVLIYRLGSLGDTVVALPALHLVARAFPDADRRMLTNIPISAKAPAAAAVLDGSGLVHGYFNYRVGTRRVLDLAALWWELVRWRPQVLVYLAAFRGAQAVARDTRFFSLCGITRQIGLPVKLEMQRNLWQESAGALEPEAERLARNLAVLGDARLDDPASWDLVLQPAEIAVARESLEPVRGRPLIAVSVGTKMQAKDWGRENWRCLLRELALAFPGHALVLCGSPDEYDASEYAAAGWRGSGSEAIAINLCRGLLPRECAAVFAQARIFIGHDSGPMHLAAAVRTPCVAIFAARNRPRVWFPYGPRHRVLYHQVDCWGCGLETCVAEQKKCILSITVAEVLAEVRAVLEGVSV